MWLLRVYRWLLEQDTHTQRKREREIETRNTHKFKWVSDYRQPNKPLMFICVESMQIYVDRISKLFDMSLLVWIQWYSQNNFGRSLAKKEHINFLCLRMVFGCS